GGAACGRLLVQGQAQAPRPSEKRRRAPAPAARLVLFARVFGSHRPPPSSAVEPSAPARKASVLLMLGKSATHTRAPMRECSSCSFRAGGSKASLVSHSTDPTRSGQRGAELRAFEALAPPGIVAD